MDIFLYAVTVLVWGTSWLAMTFQLGTVAPEVSVVYRFAIAAAVMLAFCLATRRRMVFSPRDHVFIALQGICLFSTNFFLIYLGARYMTSGLVSVGFSTIVIMNILGCRLLFATKVTPGMASGAALGIAGMFLLFWPELAAFDLSRDGSRGLILVLAGTLSAALGMLTSAWNQGRRSLPVMQTNAYGMIYGTLFMALLVVLRGSDFGFDPSPGYVFSLLYLAVCASVFGFWSYLTLVGRIGADRAAYTSVLFPVVALTLSTWFEDYHWTATGAFGVALVLCGNALILAKPRKSRGLALADGFSAQR